MWKKEQPIKGHIRGCAFNPVYDVAPMGMLIAVGFGQAFVTKDGMKIWNEENIDNPEDLWTTQDAENVAAKDPDHDWRIVLYASLYGRTFQRQDGEWVLIEENQGFA